MSVIVIVEPDPVWPSIYEEEALRLSEGLGAGALRIEHVGSTAVPGLAAKPVIDIQVSVRVIEPLSAWRDALVQIGYVHVPHADDLNHPFFHRPEDWPHEFHLHLCELGSPEERWNLAFRDYLRVHSEIREAYADEKRRLAVQYSADSFESRNAYADAKSEFIDQVVRRALNEGYGR